MNRMTTVIAAAGACLVAATAGVLAHNGATGIVKERMQLMGAMGDAMKALTSMMRSEQGYDEDEVRRLARAIADYSGEALTRLFPEGSLHGPSEALPAIWEDWERFSALANQLGDAAASLEAAAGNGRAGMPDATMMADAESMMMDAVPDVYDPDGAALSPDAAYLALTRACSGCHQAFRQEQ